MTCAWRIGVWAALALLTGLATANDAMKANEVKKVNDVVWQPVVNTHAEAAQPRLNLRLQQVEVRRLLQLLADQRSISVMISDDVKGTLTMNLVDVSAADAWVLILNAAGLAERIHQNIRYVAPAPSIAAREQATLSEAQTVEQLMPLTTQVLRIRYARAEQLLTHLSNGQSLLSGRGEVWVDERLNALVVSDVPDRVDSVSRLVSRLDVPLKQVAIEARIVTASDTLNHQLGIQWRADLSNLDTLTGETSAASDINRLVATTALAAAAPASTLALGILRPGTAIDAELSLLAEQGKARVLAKPKILTLDQSPASIESGVQIPYQETSRSGATSTSFRDAVLSLHVLPQITPDQNIMMQLKVKQDTVGQIFNGVPSINTNEIQTRVLVGNGETVVLGGILQEDANDAERKTPLLGDLPVIGRVFRRRITRQDQQELLVFVTPTLVSQPTVVPVVDAPLNSVLPEAEVGEPPP
ncbi:MAG: type IV pilus secretin PilQ [OM182 bacterium]|nr:MAG: type IV pilus secretin PilQ [OM182 bacterium]